MWIGSRARVLTRATTPIRAIGQYLVHVYPHKRQIPWPSKIVYRVGSSDNRLLDSDS